MISFSNDEVWANPYAFKKGHYVGKPSWGIPSLDYTNITDPTAESYKLLKRKIGLFAKRYDNIRFDVGWSYVIPIVTPSSTKEVLDKNKLHLQDKLIKQIENWVLEIKGNDYDLKNLFWEFEAGAKEFSPFLSNGTLIPELQGRLKVYSSTYMNKNDRYGWGYNKAFTSRGWKPDEYMLGVGNHDPQPLRNIADGVEEEVSPGIFKNHKTPAIQPLSEELKIPAKILENPIEFAKAKWAEPMMAQNNHMFYMDVFGRKERFDMQWKNNHVNSGINYGYKIPFDYELAYNKGIKEGYGFNPMDAIEKVFKAKGLDKSHPALYQKIMHFKEILLETQPEKKVTFVEISPKGVKENIFKKILKNKYFIGTTSGILLGLALLKLLHFSLHSKEKDKIDSADELSNIKSQSVTMDNFLANIRTNNK